MVNAVMSRIRDSPFLTLCATGRLRLPTNGFLETGHQRFSIPICGTMILSWRSARISIPGVTHHSNKLTGALWQGVCPINAYTAEYGFTNCRI